MTNLFAGLRPIYHRTTTTQHRMTIGDQQPEKLTVLIVGSGGREHALAWKLVQSARVERIFVAPGNGGTANLPKTVNVNVSTSGNDFSALVSFAVENNVSHMLSNELSALKISSCFPAGELSRTGSRAASCRWDRDRFP